MSSSLRKSLSLMFAVLIGISVAACQRYKSDSKHDTANLSNAAQTAFETFVSDDVPEEPEKEEPEKTAVKTSKPRTAYYSNVKKPLSQGSEVICSFEEDLDGDGVADKIEMYAEGSKNKHYISVNGCIDYPDLFFINGIENPVINVIASDAFVHKKLVITNLNYFADVFAYEYKEGSLKRIMMPTPEDLGINIIAECHDDNTVTIDIPKYSYTKNVRFDDFIAPSWDSLTTQVEAVSSSTLLELSPGYTMDYFWIGEAGFDSLRLVVEYFLYSNITNFAPSLYLYYSFQGDGVMIDSIEIKRRSHTESIDDTILLHMDGMTLTYKDGRLISMDSAQIEEIQKFIIFPEREEGFINSHHPIVINNALLGGSCGDTWEEIDYTTYDKENFSLVMGGEKYKIYSQNSLIGESFGSIPHIMTFADTEIEVIMKNMPKYEGNYVAIHGEWNALPREVKRIENSNGYEKTVREFLDEKGFKQSPVEIHSIIQTDLEGDGTDEVLISAYYIESPFGKNDKDYSYVILHRNTTDSIENIVLFEWWDQAPFYYIDDLMVLDANGDGRMEVFVFTHYYEGVVIYLFSVDGNKAECVLYYFYGL